jgi:hypothetical protein
MSLNGIQQFQNLETLSFNFNNILLFTELNRINNKFFIKEISFIGNPLEWDLRANYNFIAINLFPNLLSLNSVCRKRTKMKLHHSLEEFSGNGHLDK